MYFCSKLYSDKIPIKLNHKHQSSTSNYWFIFNQMIINVKQHLYITNSTTLISKAVKVKITMPSQQSDLHTPHDSFFKMTPGPSYDIH